MLLAISNLTIKMVYTTLEVVLGFVISKDELVKLLELELEEEGDDVLDYDIEKLFDELDYGREVKLYSFPCCSDSRGQLFIIGRSVHKYYRKPIRCDDCGKYTVCDRCIGHTNNGYYDVCAIVDKPIEVNVKHICPWCFHDNGQDLGGPQTTAPVVDQRFQPTDYNPCDRKQCTVCNGFPNEFRSQEDYMKFHNSHYYSQLKKIQKDYEWEKPMKFYYMIDDCLSCT